METDPAQIRPGHPDWPEDACERCSYLYLEDDGEIVGTTVWHGAGTRCDQDPTLPKNVIAAYFKAQNPTYIGIVWEAIANGALRALDEAGYVIHEPVDQYVTPTPL